MLGRLCFDFWVHLVCVLYLLCAQFSFIIVSSPLPRASGALKEKKSPSIIKIINWIDNTLMPSLQERIGTCLSEPLSKVSMVRNCCSAFVSSLATNAKPGWVGPEMSATLEADWAGFEEAIIMLNKATGSNVQLSHQVQWTMRYARVTRALALLMQANGVLLFALISPPPLFGAIPAWQRSRGPKSWASRFLVQVPTPRLLFLGEGAGGRGE
jgi:hypothetical protein